MSIEALNWALKQDNIKHSGAKFVLVVLANYADDEGYCYPSRETIASKTSISIRSVQEHLNWLHQEGYISKQNRKTDSRQTSNLYRVEWDKKPSAKSALRDEKPSADSAKAECEMAQKPSAKSALNTKGEEPKKETKEEEGETHASDSDHSDGIPQEFFASRREDIPPDSTPEPIVESVSDCEAVAVFENAFQITVGKSFAEKVALHVENLSVWKELIIEKIAYADDPIYQRTNIPKWFLKAYNEKLNKLGANQNGQYQTAREKQRDTAISNEQFIQDLQRQFAPTEQLHGAIDTDYKMLN
jgi:hypothetical protein